MTDLTDFLLARFAEDEDTALVWGSSGPSRHRREGTRPPYLDPTRVLAGCEAKRVIVTWAAEMNADRVALRGAPVLNGMASLIGACEALDLVLRAFALPYADCPDFDPAWRVTP